MADWTRENSAPEQSDTVLLGDTLVRVGLTDTLEAQIGWTPFGHVRVRDKLTGTIDKASRVGDVLVGFKSNLHAPDGSGTSAAIQPFATLPTGRAPLGSGDWGAGVVAPVSFDLRQNLHLQFSPEIDAATDEDGHGRHFAYGSVVGLGVDVSDAVEVTFEVAASQDNDPQEHSTEVFGALSATWMPSHDLQFDVGTTLGLNHDAPDMELYVGISRQL